MKKMTTTVTVRTIFFSVFQCLFFFHARLPDAENPKTHKINSSDASFVYFDRLQTSSCFVLILFGHPSDILATHTRTRSP